MYFWSWAIDFFSLSIFSILAGLDAFFCIRKSQVKDINQAQTSTKNGWLAIFLSLVCPGLGHAYLKRWMEFLLYLLIYLLFVFLNPRFAKIYILFLRISACIHVGVIFNKTINKKDFYKFIVAAIMILSATNFVIPLLRARYIVHGNFITTTSMVPTIKSGDLILVNHLAYIFGKPQIGDIIEIHSNIAPANLDANIRERLKLKERYLIKRVVATGGDTIQIKKDGVYVNGLLQKSIGIGNSMGRSMLQLKGIKIERLAIQQPYRVPEKSFFVLGDNIEDSVDSRDFGQIPQNKITGKVIKIFSPKKPTSD